MLIKNGYIVASSGCYKGDIRIDGELIGDIRECIVPRPDEKVMDATGKIILPGGVDVHTHMDFDLGNLRATDNFYTGTVAAAFGGTTTIVDHMAFGPKGCSIRHQLDRYHRMAEGRAVIDYGFHGVTGHVDHAVLDELKKLADEGVTSHKVYLTYGGMLSDSQVIPLMERTADLGLMLCVHSENHAAVHYLREKYAAERKLSPLYHAKSRPPECEAEAVFRMAMFARMLDNAPLYIVHLSSALALEQVRHARWGGQKNLFVETCPQYLYLDENRYLDGDGLKYIMNPPLRTEKDNKTLWKGMVDGEVDTVATDHCPFFYRKEKQMGKQDFRLAPGGVPGVETRMALMFSEVASGRLTFPRLVALCCETPARLFGLYPQKGVIAPGSDADLVLFDHGRQSILTRTMLHENTDYTPYEGMVLNGLPVVTISRGEVIVKDGQFMGGKGRGRYIKRGLPDLSNRTQVERRICN